MLPHSGIGQNLLETREHSRVGLGQASLPWWLTHLRKSLQGQSATVSVTRYLASFHSVVQEAQSCHRHRHFLWFPESLRQCWVLAMRFSGKDQKDLKRTSGIKRPASTLIQTSSVAVTLCTSEEKGQLGVSKKNLGSVVKRMLYFGPALQCSVWLYSVLRLSKLPLFSNF